MTSQQRVLRVWVVALVLAMGTAALVLTAASAASGARASAASRCTPPKYPGHGYFSSLSVSGTSCSTGRQLVLAFYRCRLKHGAAGRCRSTVLGFSCSERRQSIPTELDARVTCRRHRATVTHTYQQDL
jgi:hypothetical protein